MSEKISNQGKTPFYDLIESHSIPKTATYCIIEHKELRQWHVRCISRLVEVLEVVGLIN